MERSDIRGIFPHFVLLNVRLLKDGLISRGAIRISLALNPGYKLREQRFPAPEHRHERSGCIAI
jgi:hypothetical protein